MCYSQSISTVSLVQVLVAALQPAIWHSRLCSRETRGERVWEVEIFQQHMNNVRFSTQHSWSQTKTLNKTLSIATAEYRIHQSKSVQDFFSRWCSWNGSTFKGLRVGGFWEIPRPQSARGVASGSGSITLAGFGGDVLDHWNLLKTFETWLLFFFLEMAEG